MDIVQAKVDERREKISKIIDYSSSLQEVEKKMQNYNQLGIATMIMCKHRFNNQRFSYKFFTEKTKEIDWKRLLWETPSTVEQWELYKIFPKEFIVELKMKGIL